MSVKAIRGTERRTISKWESQGWEFHTQTPGAVRTDLTFRRVKPKTSKGPLIAIGGLIAVVAIGLSIGLIGYGGDDDAKQASSRKENAATPTPTPASTVPAGPLTAANNADVASLLKVSDYCDDSIGAFATKYEGQTIRFDGVITSSAPHGDYDTRYDLLISPGSNVETTIGPAFKYEDVNTVDDFGWTGSNVPDSVGRGSKLRFTAEVGGFNRDQCLFYLDPVSTEGR